MNTHFQLLKSTECYALNTFNETPSMPVSQLSLYNFGAAECSPPQDSDIITGQWKDHQLQDGACEPRCLLRLARVTRVGKGGSLWSEVFHVRRHADCFQVVLPGHFNAPELPLLMR